MSEENKKFVISKMPLWLIIVLIVIVVVLLMAIMPYV